MTRHALLNNTEHRDLRVITARGGAYGDDVMFSLTFPAEFRNVQAHYPIVFGKAHYDASSPRWRCLVFARNRTCSSSKTAGTRSIYR